MLRTTVSDLPDVGKDTKRKSRIKLNVRGTKFETYKQDLEAFPDSRLSNLDRHSEFWDEQENEYFFNRDPEMFNAILNMYVHNELHVPKHICGTVFRQELEFWKISSQHLSECCWRAYYQIEDDRDVLADLRKVTPLTPKKHNRVSPPREGGKKIFDLGHKVWLILDDPNVSKTAKIWNCFYLVAVAVSTLVFFLGSVESLRTDLYLSSLDATFYNESHQRIPNWKLRLYYIKDPIPLLLGTELICLVVFTAEIVLNFTLCPSKRRFFCNAMNIIVLINVFFMWLSFLLEFCKGEMVETKSTAILYILVRCLTACRVLLFLRLERHFSAFRVLLFAIRSSLKELMLLCMTFCIATIIFACAIFYAEIFDEETYDNMFISMWWAVITMTTIGYGDYTPTTTIGYLVGVICAVFGLLILAMPVAIIASNFSDYYVKNKDRQRHIQSAEKSAETSE